MELAGQSHDVRILETTSKGFLGQSKINQFSIFGIDMVQQVWFLICDSETPISRYESSFEGAHKAEKLTPLAISPKNATRAQAVITSEEGGYSIRNFSTLYLSWILARSCDNEYNRHCLMDLFCICLKNWSWCLKASLVLRSLSEKEKKISA